jgi:hypothetical protein
MKVARLCCLAVLILLTGCMLPKVVNHPQPGWKVDFAPFEKGGCPLDESGYFRRCTPEGALYALGCDRLEQATDFLGGLEPALPIAVCLYEPRNRPELADPWNVPGSEYFFNVGGPLPDLLRYVIVVDGDFKLIKNEDEFRSVFAPVDSADEALSYVLAVRELYASYGLKFNWKYRYEVDLLEDTRVEAIEGGYLVHVFDYDFFGCGPHYYFAVDVKVTPAGRVEEVSRTRIYRNPAEDEVCVD